MRAFIHAEQVEEIVFTRGTTDAINLVARSYGEAFVGPGETRSWSAGWNTTPPGALADALPTNRAKLTILPFDDEGNLCLNAYEQLLSSKTRLVAVTQVSTCWER